MQINHADIPGFLKSQGAIGQGMYDQLLAAGHKKSALDAAIKGTGITVGAKLQSSNPGLSAKPARTSTSTPDIRSLSAYDLNKIQQSLNQYNKSLEGTPRPGIDRGPGFRSMTTANQEKAAREPFKSGGTYGIEDEYRYMVSQGFKPQAAQTAPAAPAAPAASQQQPQQYKPEQLQVRAQEPVQTGPTAADLAVERLTKEIAASQAAFQSSLQQQAQMFAEQSKAQEQRMSDLQQQMIQSQVAAAERPKTVGVKAATGAGGTQMAIARRGATGAFGRGGMRISSLNV